MIITLSLCHMSIHINCTCRQRPIPHKSPRALESSSPTVQIINQDKGTGLNAIVIKDDGVIGQATIKDDRATHEGTTEGWNEAANALGPARGVVQLLPLLPSSSTVVVTPSTSWSAKHGRHRRPCVLKEDCTSHEENGGSSTISNDR